MKFLNKKTAAKILAGILAISISAANVYAADINIDFSSNAGIENAPVSAVTTLTDAGHESVWKISPLKGNTKMFYSSITTNGVIDENSNKYKISFDFKMAQTDQFYRFICRNAGANIACFMISSNGNIIISKKGNEVEETSVSSGLNYIFVPYQQDKWYRMDLIIDAESKDVNYYLDGENIAAAISAAPVSKPQICYFGTSQTENCVSDGTECWYIDNFSATDVQNAGAPELSIGGEVSSEKMSVNILSSQTLVKNKSYEGFKMYNTETGEQIPVDAGYSNGTISVNFKDMLEPDSEYAVFIPDNVVSILGEKAVQEAVYFQTEKTTQVPEMYTEVFSNDFSGSGVPFIPEGEESVGAWGWKYISKNNEKFSQPVLRFNPMWCFDDGEVRKTDSYSQAIQINNSKYKISMDLYKSGNYYYSMHLIGAGGQFGMFALDEFGNIVIPAKQAFGDVLQSKKNYTGEETYKPQAADFSREKWNKLEIYVDSDGSENMVYYLNGQKVGVSTAGNTDYRLKKIWAGLSGKKGNVNSALYNTDEYPGFDGTDDYLYIDNFKIFAAQPGEDNRVEEVRFEQSDGSMKGPLTKSLETDTPGGYIRFMNDVDITTLNNCFTVKNGDEKAQLNFYRYDNEEKKAYFKLNSVLQANAKYNILYDDGICRYSSYITVEDKKGFEIKEFFVTDGNGNLIENSGMLTDTAGLKLSISNTTEEMIPLYIFEAFYKDGALIGFGHENVELNCNEKITQSAVSLSSEIVPDKIVAGVWRTDTKRPQRLVSVGDGNNAAEDNLTLSFAATFGKEHANHKGGIIAAAPGNDLDAVFAGNASEFERYIAYIGVVKADDNGDFAGTFKLKDDPGKDYDAATGEYKFYAADNDNAWASGSIVFINQNDMENAVAELGNLYSQNEFEQAREYIIANHRKFGIKDECADKITGDMASKMIRQYIAEGGILNCENAQMAAFAVRKAVLAENIACGNISDLKIYIKELGIDAGRLKNFYAGSYADEALYNKVAACLKGKSFSSLKNFDKQFNEYFALAVVEKHDGIGNAKSIISEFSSEIGVTANYSESVYNSVAGVWYQSFAELLAALNKAQSAANNRPSGGSGGGSGSIISVPSLTPEPTEYNVEIFDDLEEALWAKDMIVYLAEHRIISGKGDGNFYPNENITRAELTVLALRAFANNTTEGNTELADMRGHWANESVKRALALGIVSGYEDNTFRPDNKITREDMAVILYRAAIANGMEFSEIQDDLFYDAENISAYARDAVGYLGSVGIISGKGNNSFEPAMNATRAEAARIIYGLLNY